MYTFRDTVVISNTFKYSRLNWNRSVKVQTKNDYTNHLRVRDLIPKIRFMIINIKTCRKYVHLQDFAFRVQCSSLAMSLSQLFFCKFEKHC